MVSFFGALTLGILYGLGPCTLFCAPILVPLIMATAKSGKEGIVQVFNFGFGRISAYIFLAGISGYAGYLLREIISQKLISIFVIFLGVFILIRSRESCPFFLTKVKNREISFLSGFVIGLGPCPPLLALLSLAALEKSFLTGLGMGLVFGLGSLITPLIIFGFLAGRLAILKEFKNVASITSAIFLIIFGLIKFLFGL